MQKGIILLLAFGISLTSQGQSVDEKSVKSEILTLDDCMRIALKNNVELKRAKNSATMAKSNDFQAIMNFLPSVNAFADYRFANGTNFNNFTGELVNASFRDSYPGVQANWTVFNGMSNVYNKKSSAERLEASTHQIQAQKQLVQSTVLGSYLAVVLDRENIKIAHDRIELLEAQLGRAKNRYDVGVANLEQVYNFQSQLANERLNLVTLQNQLMSDKLNLAQILRLENIVTLEIAEYDFQGGEQLLAKESFKSLLDQSMSYSPQLKSAEAFASAADYTSKASHSSYLPSVNLIGNYSTQFSTLNAGENGEVPIMEQYQNLTFKSVRLQVQIPIFNNYLARNQVQRARVNYENAILDLEQAEMTVTNTIQQVYLDLVSAQEAYKAAEENLNALNQTFEFVKTRYEAGNTDFYTYLESLNSKNRAELQLINAKYSIVFRKKILDVYRGML